MATSKVRVMLKHGRKMRFFIKEVDYIPFPGLVVYWDGLNGAVIGSVLFVNKEYRADLASVWEPTSELDMEGQVKHLELFSFDEVYSDSVWQVD